MKEKLVSVALPTEIIELAKKSGFDEKALAKMMRKFAVLQIASFSGELSKKQATNLDRKIKAIAWKKVRKKLKI